MNSLKFFFVPASAPIVTCPNCGDSHYESNRFDETLLLEVEREASLLRHQGKLAKARELLTAVAAVKIESRLRHEHFCLSCGIQFDG